MSETESMNLLEQAIKDEVIAETFNEKVHVLAENGIDPARNADGSITKKKHWQKSAEDRQGRTYNEKVHGAEPILDAEGFLKVRRRDPDRVQSDTSRSEAFVKKHAEKGYAYYLMNDEGGRMEQFVSNDWEPVMVKGGKASMPVGQARAGNTSAILMKKPLEWYNDDQERKVERNKARFKETTSPKEGQYEGTAQPGSAAYTERPGSPLR